MRSLILGLACLVALTISGRSAAAASAFRSYGAPKGFSELAKPHLVPVDVFFGGRKIIETYAVTQPGTLRFKSPADVLSQIPDLMVTPDVSSALAGPFPTNTQDVCSPSNARSCGELKPQVIGIIYDEDRFRVDIFVNPKFLRTSRARPEGYLPIPSASLSLTSALGLNVSGSTGGSSVYNLQDRTIIGLHNGRIRANLSVASGYGLIVDDLVGEIDRKNLRYSAGMFWAPGNDFIGQRRILGAGVGTQFDTWADQAELHGTPLIVFLSSPARVELLVDGRLVSSHSYAAGNVELDTSELPAGSYPVLLRIREANGSIREDTRFFVKNAEVPPAGHPIYYAYAGLLANTESHRPVSLSNTIYYQTGTAWRLSNKVAFDAAVLGTQHKAIVQAGAWFISGRARIRAAGLYSSAGDWGALLQGSTAGHSPLSINFDLRRIWSHDGKPLIPLPTYANSFDLSSPSGVQLANGSYSQATASVGLRLGPGYVSIVGSYRKDQGLPSDYTIGPSVNWPVLTRNQVQIVFEASAQRTRTSKAAFGGFRLLFNSGRLSVLSTVGRGIQSDQEEPSRSRMIGTLTAQYSYQTDQSSLNVGGGVDRNIDSSNVHAEATFQGRSGNLQADVLHNLEGRRDTQYDVALQSGVALGVNGVEIGARDLQQSAMVIAVSGDAPDAVFRVLVNEIPRGQVRIGHNLLLFVPPYRSYNVRLVPVAAVPVDYDTASREITLYPGNVQSLAWRAQSYFTLFGRAISETGSPIPEALVQSAKGIAQTDAKGYFQVDVRRGDPITIAKTDGRSCQIRLGKVIVKNDFASVGTVLCE